MMGKILSAESVSAASPWDQTTCTTKTQPQHPSPELGLSTRMGGMAKPGDGLVTLSWWGGRASVCWAALQGSPWLSGLGSDLQRKGVGHCHWEPSCVCTLDLRFSPT